MADGSEAGGTVERVFITMPDGTRLATTLFLPASDDPVPCVLEALPYRKDDLTATYRPEYVRLRDEHGYAVARVDVRGTGSSDGLAIDEYPEQEQRDLCDVIAWLAEQPWCTGAVGMYGTSYSGFNSLQVACERPPALKAIIAIYATDDRYTDDVHKMGGSLRLLDLVDYPAYMVAMNALPPVPALVGDELARRLATPGGRARAVAAAMAGGAARLGVLAARLGAAGVRPDRVRDDAGRRLGRRLPQQHVPHRAGAARERHAAPAAARAVEPHVDGDVAAGAAHRPGAGDGPLVGPLAAGHRRRVRRRAGADLVPAGVDPALPGPPDGQGRVAHSSAVAADGCPRGGARPGRRRGGLRRGRGRRHRGVEQLRRRAAVGAADRPA